MSIEVMSKVLRNSLLPEGERFALVVLADFGNDDGIGIYASRKTIAKRMGASVTTVNRRLANLKACGVLDWEVNAHEHGGGTTTNEYKILVGIIGKEDISKVKTRKQMEDERRGGALHVETGGALHVETGVLSTWKHNPLDKPSVEPLATRLHSQNEGANKPEINQNPTQPLQEEKEVEQKATVPPAAAPAAPAAPARAPAPPTGTRKPDPEQVRRADDLLQRHIAHKDGGKLTNWNITRKSIEAAIANKHHDDKAAIKTACSELADTISEIVNDYQWRFWRDRKQALKIIELDLTLDAIAAYVRADCDSIAQKQKDREGYGIGDALQAVRIALAAQNGPPKKAEMREEQYEDPVTGEIRLRWME